MPKEAKWDVTRPPPLPPAARKPRARPAAGAAGRQAPRRFGRRPLGEGRRPRPLRTKGPGPVGPGGLVRRVREGGRVVVERVGGVERRPERGWRRRSADVRLDSSRPRRRQTPGRFFPACGRPAGSLAVPALCRLTLPSATTPLLRTWEEPPAKVDVGPGCCSVGSDASKKVVAAGIGVVRLTNPRRPGRAEIWRKTPEREKKRQEPTSP